MKNVKNIKWPDLKEIGHIKGRLATEEDIKSGNAVFVLQSNSGELKSAPIDIDIPQYALHINKETGEETPGVIVQAEEAAQGQQVVGFLPIGSNKFLAALFHEFTLLGTRKPKQSSQDKRTKKQVKKTPKGK